MKLILFDIDGTLLFAGAGKAASNHAFREVFGVEDSWGDLDSRGSTDRTIFAEIGRRILGREITAEEIDLLAERYLAALAEELPRAAKFQLLPGVVSLLERLTGREGLLIGLETGNLERGARLKLERGEINHHFSFGGFGCDSEERSEIVRIAIERGQGVCGGRIEEVVVIGDAAQDVRAGKAVGARTVAVLTSCRGDREKEGALRDLAPDLVVQDFTEESLWRFLGV